MKNPCVARWRTFCLPAANSAVLVALELRRSDTRHPAPRAISTIRVTDAAVLTRGVNNWGQLSLAGDCSGGARGSQASKSGSLNTSMVGGRVPGLGSRRPRDELG